jgi:hypothetical protein
VRRQLSIPRPLLVGAGIGVPGRVLFERAGEAVVMRGAAGGEAGGQMLSKVGQVVTPTWVMQTLRVGVGGAIYARAGTEGFVELVAGSGVRVEGEVAA